jgi:hypothetical protein
LLVVVVALEQLELVVVALEVIDVLLVPSHQEDSLLLNQFFLGLLIQLIQSQSVLVVVDIPQDLIAFLLP